MRGIAHERCTRANHARCQLHDEWIGRIRSVDLHGARKICKARIQFGIDVLDRHGRDGFGRAAFHVPGKIRPIVRHRQGRKRSFRCEQLARNASMRAVQLHIGGEDGLIVIMPFGLDPDGASHG